MMTSPHSIINTPRLPHQKSKLAFLWDQEIPNGQSSCNLWATAPTGSTLNSSNIITRKVISSFESLLSNTPLGGLLEDDMRLGKTIQAISLIGTSKEWLITKAHLFNHQLEMRNIQTCSGWSTESQYLPWPHSSLII
ncbi:hypothetical protein O181_089226 [Austropuccinia psidii MF-1]|uniref:SNF2 N-terminal domain-containing protein n=1 Tax=Austropuccinia psidii MF-1 TaxID=1389203 RepID=A0A9Q3IT69_9BASI|nr:hypothetical protein [Austropuccinia psidii MF-1]